MWFEHTDHVEVEIRSVQHLEALLDGAVLCCGYELLGYSEVVFNNYSQCNVEG